MILIDLENPSRDVLEQMFQVSRVVKRPVAMFVDQSDSASIQAAVDAGVSAYIVDGLKKERMHQHPRSVHFRFNAFARLQCELDRRQRRAGRAQGHRPRQGRADEGQELTEEQAYALLRKTAMNENKKIADIAQSVITASEIFK